MTRIPEWWSVRVDPRQPLPAPVAGRRHRPGRHLRWRGRGVPPPLNDDLLLPPYPEPSDSVSASSRQVVPLLQPTVSPMVPSQDEHCRTK